ncbi:hypothetical protein [Streptomyces sp. NPDC051173]|uniref:hypothetical protein n=1 Tax=Streptomyces sp. NPDC051173 TaxID=3155164 RepID=UPI00344FE330
MSIQHNRFDLREVDGLLLVGPPETPLFSVPRRRSRPPKVRLAPGEWHRWQINYRFGDQNGPWGYRLETFNVSYGPNSPEVFLGPPTRTVDGRGPLC